MLIPDRGTLEMPRSASSDRAGYVYSTLGKSIHRSTLGLIPLNLRCITSVSTDRAMATICMNQRRTVLGIDSIF